MTEVVDTAGGIEEIIEADVSRENKMVAPELALAIREERHTPLPAVGSLPSEREWQATIAVASEIAGTPFVPDSYRGRPESVVAAILTGRELGIGPMQSLRDIHMIDGRPTFSATLMLSQMRKGGVRILESASTEERAFIRAQREDTGEVAEVEWTFAEAERIIRKGKKLVDGDNWRNYPADMLWARAVGRVARRLGSDLLGGMVYSAEELRDLDPEESGYGASTSQPEPEPVKWEELKPGEMLHPLSPAGWKDIDLTLRTLDGARDWTKIVKGILSGKYRAASVKYLGEKERREVGYRLANFAGYLAEVVMQGQEFPPPGDEDVLTAMKWAFEGLTMDLPEEPLEAEVVEEEESPLSEEQMAAMAREFEGEDVPFGSEEEK